MKITTNLLKQLIREVLEEEDQTRPYRLRYTEEERKIPRPAPDKSY